MSIKRLIIIFAVSTVHDVFSQVKPIGQGSLYFTWGYNRASYTNSNIRFKDTKTDDYNFTLYKAKSKDQPDMEEILHRPITVPQYVFNLGWFFAKKPGWGVEASWDHLKYVVKDNQVMHLKGNIRGVYYDQDTLVTPAFMHLEHTNGNNYLMGNVVRRYTLLESKKGYHRLSSLAKMGVGVLYPKTDSYIMGNHNDGPFRVSGYVVSSSMSLRYDIFKYVFIEGTLKGAFANYTNAKLYESGRAKHRFLSAEIIGAFGVNIPLSK